MSEEDTKAALKAALKEWLDEKYAALGRWSVRTLGVMALGALVWFILTANGWHQIGR